MSTTNEHETSAPTSQHKSCGKTTRHFIFMSFHNIHSANIPRHELSFIFFKGDKTPLHKYVEE